MPIVGSQKVMGSAASLPGTTTPAVFITCGRDGADIENTTCAIDSVPGNPPVALVAPNSRPLVGLASPKPVASST